ncbi:MAG: DUF952 domain-containing protein [Alphaproteobacteria bacterium]|nr:DUF952 domain-containing protein [Alphaproteobacteria bacterium]MBU0797247.1 DUF952 domain-containing protein [Alphaproteobacteria bacterium]MBU0888965.1 DUF952 domain-containing protein [Alphaproteobacteria bacterium]MBU1813985.1 DUF952 domain-containing protein [Alphaproteobacteria bacterium]MBU2091291.1 DUF952 domain-containing protein [Alphaproteobacteria bacterium]
MATRIIYTMARNVDWREAETHGAYQGSTNDRADGFIHFSTAAQVVASAAKHRAGETDLLLVAVESDRLGAALKWEPARGGQLFPHLYAALSLNDVLWAKPLPLGSDGQHLFPAFEDKC